MNNKLAQIIFILFLSGFLGGHMSYKLKELKRLGMVQSV